MSKPDLLLGPCGSQWKETLATTNKTHASEIKRLHELNAKLVAENECLKDNVYVLNKTLADLGFELKTVQL